MKQERHIEETENRTAKVNSGQTDLSQPGAFVVKRGKANFASPELSSAGALWVHP